MAQSTRSKALSIRSGETDGPSVTDAETEILNQRMAQRENQLKEQAELLHRQRTEYENEREEPAYIRELFRKMERMEQKIQKIQERANTEDRDRETATRSVIPENNENFELRSQREHLALPQTFENTQPRRDSNSFCEISPLRLKDVADSIPKYDGQRMSVFQFCQACERALKLIPAHQERYLVQLIMGRLQGHAYTIMQDSSHLTVEPLLRKLKQIFGPNKSLNQYRGELGNIYMRHNEDILEYITRIKELQTAIIDAEIAARGGDLDTITRYSIDRDVLDSFINGLPSDLLIRIKIEGYTTLYLDDAFAKAIQLSKTMETEALRRRPAYNNPTTKFIRRDAPPPRRDAPPARYDSRPPQYNIQSRGSPFIKPLIPGIPGPNAPRQIICYYCKKPGHIASECRRKANDNRQAPRVEPEPVPSTSRQYSGNETRAPIKMSVQRDTLSSGRQVTTAQVVPETAEHEPQ